MTVSYTEEVATAKLFTFVKLLFRWRGSIYKLLYKDLMIYLAIYYLVTFTYLFAMTDDQKFHYENFIKGIKNSTSAVPLSFVLGFFVNMIFARWWNQYQAIPWPSAAAVYISSCLHGYDEVGRAMRRTCMRYLCLSLTMVLRVLSPRVKKRFPKLKDLIGAGLLNENEYSIIETMESKFPGYSKNWLPIVWAAAIITRARKEGRIHDDFAAKTIISEFNAFRGKCGSLMSYYTISIPLVYTQVVTIATYSYFLIALFASQYVKRIDDEDLGLKILDLIPFLTILQFVFYMGWLKVAEALMNPFGEDDDDFEVNSIVDRNLQMSYLIVDEMHNDHPELLKDQYWHEIPAELPDKGKFLDDEKGKPVLQETDIIDFDVVQRNSLFGKEKVVPVKIEPAEVLDSLSVKVQVEEADCDSAQKLSTPVPEPTPGISAHPSILIPENLKPDANVIADVYKKKENVEEEQLEIKETIEKKKRRKTGRLSAELDSDGKEMETDVSHLNTADDG